MHDINIPRNKLGYIYSQPIKTKKLKETETISFK